jgi:hypothetical protein
MSREELKKFGQDMPRVAMVILLLGGLMASAVYQLDRVGVSGVWGVILAAVLTLIFFTVVSRSPVLPTVVVVAVSFGPPLVSSIVESKVLGPSVLVIAFGVALLGLLLFLALRNPDAFKGRAGWWVAPAIFAVMFLTLGILGKAGVLGKSPGVGEALVLGTASVLCLLAGIWSVVAAANGTEWADKGGGILFIICGGVLIAVTIVVAVVEHDRTRRFNEGAKHRAEVSGPTMRDLIAGARSTTRNCSTSCARS